MLFINISIFFISIGIVCSVALLSAEQPSYQVGVEDILSVTVWGEEELDKTTVVTQDGTINYPLVGNIPVAGLTVSEIDEKLTRMLAADYLVDPQVDVNVKEYRSQKVLVLGEVKNPGLYILTGVTSLLEIISRSGGVSDKVGNKVSIFRSGNGNRKVEADKDIFALLEEGKGISIDLEELLKKGNLSCNTQLQPGDIVFLPGKKDANVSEQQIYVSGQVKKPGAYEYQKGLTALNACILAGGFEKTSAPNRTILSRGSDGRQQVLKINLNEVKDGKKQDIQLQPGDRLYVPESFW